MERGVPLRELATKTGLTRLPSAPRLMLVDDDPFVREVALAALSAVPGVTVKACASGAEALTVIEGFAPDLVLLDLMMPAMDGYATWTEIVKRGGKPPRLIFLTGCDDADTRDQAAAVGAAGVIVKPFDPSTFAATVLAVVDAAAAKAVRLDAVTRAFAADLPATLGAIAAAWEAMAGAWQAGAAETLLIEVHKLAGVAAMFQFRSVGDAADEVEGLLRAANKNGGWRSAAEHAVLEDAVRVLMEEGRKASAG